MTEETLFVAALQRQDPTERNAFLDEACAGDEVLRRRVEALLASHEGGDHFLRSPAMKQLAASEDATVGPAMPAGQPAEPRTASAGVELDAVLRLLEPAQRPNSLGRLKHYEVLEVLGRGGFGTVLKVFDDKLHRVVAIKLLAPELATSGTARERFLREARAAAAVRHEHVIDIHAVDEEPIPHLVMEYIDGQTLQQKLDQAGARPLKEVLRVGLQIAEGLAAAHKQGLIHRDIKPSNILLENGVERVKISDFGLARAVDDASLTRSGLVAGTPLYMSPEQAEGQHLDQRSDLFSLGSVLYTLCCGRPPFRAESSLAVLRRVCEDTPHPLRDITSDIPEWLVAVIAKLHAKKPAERIQSARELADRLAKHLSKLQMGGVAVPDPSGEMEGNGESQQGDSQTQTQGEGAARVSPNPRLRVGLTAGRVLVSISLLVVLGALATWLMVARPWQETGRNGQPDLDGVALGPNPLDRFQHKDIPKALLALAGGGDSDQAPPELVAMLDDSQARQVAVQSVAFSPDGQTLATAGADHNVRLWDLAAARASAAQPPVRILKGHTDEVRSLAFSRDGKLLASGSFDNTIVLWDVAGGKEVRTLAGHARNPGKLAFSRDGQTVAAGSEDGKVRLWDVATGRPKEPLHAHGNTWVRAVAYSPDGKYLASASLDQTVQACDPLSGRRLFALKGANSGYVSLAYSTDGKWLAAGTTKPNDTLHLWDTDTKQERSMKGAGPLHSLAFQPNGNLIATGSSNGALQFWQPAEHGFQIRTIGPGPFGDCLYGVAFSPDGRYLAAAGSNGAIALLRVPAPPPAYSPGPARKLPDPLELAQRDSPADKLKLEDTLPALPVKAIGEPGKTSPKLVAILGKVSFLHSEHGANAAVTGVAYSPDGKFVASANGRFDPQAGTFTGWEVKLWEADTGKAVRDFPGHADMVHAIGFSPDGHRLVTGCRDGTVKVWAVATGKELLSLNGQTARVRSVAFSPDGKLVASGSTGAEGKVILWDAATGKNKLTFDKQTGGVLHVAFSCDSTLLASAGELGDGSVRVLETDTGKEIAQITANTANPRAAVFSRDNKRLVIAGHHEVVQAWDVATQQLAFEMKGHKSGVVGLDRSRDGSAFATASMDGTVILWEAGTGQLIRSFPGHSHGAVCVAFHPDGKTLASGDGTGQVNIWETATGNRRFPQQHTGQVMALAVSADGKHLASAGNDATVRLWDLATGRLCHHLSGHEGRVWTVAISPDGQTLASAGVDRTLRLWDVAAGKELHVLTGHGDAIQQVAFAPDGQAVASAGSEGAVKLWDVKTGRLLSTFRGAGTSWCLAFSPDGKTLAAGDDDVIRLWDVGTGWCVAALRGQKSLIRSLAFHPDGQTLASSANDADPTVRIWDLTTCMETQALAGHTGTVLSCAWRADGGFLVSCGATDGTARFWDLTAGKQHGQELLLLPAETSFLHGLALTAEGRYLATANPDGTIYILKLAEPGEVFRVMEPRKPE